MINFSKRMLASDCVLVQIFGALAKRWGLGLLMLGLIALIPLIRNNKDIVDAVLAFISRIFDFIPQNQWYRFFLFSILILIVMYALNTLTTIFSLQKKETRITWCQIFILLAIGLWILGLLLIFNITDKTINTAAFGIAASLLAWIFQDAIRGVVAFIHLRMNNLLQIDDWIKVPKYGINGKIRRVTLTTVTVYNWDTTTSAIPTSILLSEHFVNLQKMVDGKTHGRIFSKLFVMDTGSFYELSRKDADRFRKDNRITSCLPLKDIHDEMTNAELYRQYMFHWLMNNEHVSRVPYLTVSWQDHTENGLALQLTGLIKDSNAAAFEWQQSLIVEHVIQSVEWFGLRLYQTPSSFDTSSSTIYISKKPITK